LLYFLIISLFSISLSSYIYSFTSMIRAMWKSVIFSILRILVT
jgi:hypothetical protein